MSQSSKLFWTCGVLLAGFVLALPFYGKSTLTIERPTSNAAQQQAKQEALASLDSGSQVDAGDEQRGVSITAGAANSFANLRGTLMSNEDDKIDGEPSYSANSTPTEFDSESDAEIASVSSIPTPDRVSPRSTSELHQTIPSLDSTYQPLIGEVSEQPVADLTRNAGFQQSDLAQSDLIIMPDEQREPFAANREPRRLPQDNLIGQIPSQPPHFTFDARAGCLIGRDTFARTVGDTNQRGSEFSFSTSWATRESSTHGARPTIPSLSPPGW